MGLNLGYKYDSPTTSSISQPSSGRLTTSEILFLESIGLKVKKHGGRTGSEKRFHRRIVQ